MPDWWLLLITGLLEIPLGVLALRQRGATLAALDHWGVGYQIAAVSQYKTVNAGDAKARDRT